MTVKAKIQGKSKRLKVKVKERYNPQDKSKPLKEKVKH